MYELTQIIAQTIIVRDLQKTFITMCKSYPLNAFDIQSIRQSCIDSVNAENLLDQMLSEYIKAFDGIMIIETITEKPLNHTAHEKPY